MHYKFSNMIINKVSFTSVPYLKKYVILSPLDNGQQQQSVSILY